MQQLTASDISVSSADDGLSTSLDIGLVIGVVAAVMIVLSLEIIIVFRRRRQHIEHSSFEAGADHKIMTSTVTRNMASPTELEAKGQQGQSRIELDPQQVKPRYEMSGS